MAIRNNNLNARLEQIETEKVTKMNPMALDEGDAGSVGEDVSGNGGV